MGTFIRLVEYDSPAKKKDNFGNSSNEYVVNERDFYGAPGNSYAYWINKKYLKAYADSEKIEKYITTFQGIISGNNDILLRLWHEVSKDKIPFDIETIDEVDLQKQYWIPYNKGGTFRKWYGIQDYVINWENGHDDKTRGKKGFSKYYLNPYVAWSYTVSGSIATRYYQPGFLWDVRGSGIFGKHEDIVYLAALISSKPSFEFFKIDSSVMSCQVENILNLPIKIQDKTTIVELAEKNIEIAKEEWDEFEISWNYKEHPLLSGGNSYMAVLIEDRYKEYAKKCDERFQRMKSNEIKLNEDFIGIYGLDGELDANVSDEDITLRKADLVREIKSLISYAVGCIMGRYSLKEEGLIFAGGTWEENRYSSDFMPCEFGVLPITEEQFFEEDLCTRVIDFIKVVYGEDTLTENLKFVASALKPDSFEAPKKIIREYLFNEFFDNHYQIYQHRPIYWQLDSGKAGGFRAIVYMHRFTENTLPLVRTEFIQDLRYKYEEEMQRQKGRLEGASSTAEANAIKKDIAALDKKIVECAAYDELLNHATSSIQNYLFDLDDGVKTNYAKFLSIDGDKNSNILTVVKL